MRGKWPTYKGPKKQIGASIYWSSHQMHTEKVIETCIQLDIFTKPWISALVQSVTSALGADQQSSDPVPWHERCTRVFTGRGVPPAETVRSFWSKLIHILRGQFEQMQGTSDQMQKGFLGTTARGPLLHWVQRRSTLAVPATYLVPPPPPS